MTTKQKMYIGAGVLVVVLILGAVWFWGQGTGVTTPLAQVPEAEVATTTDTTTHTPIASTIKNLPPEPIFILPFGATAIDDYAFVQDGQLYFRSLTSKSPLAIPDSDGDSFEKLSQFMTFPGTQIVKDCGASGTYGYYGDDKHVYFYQFWRAPEFRSSTIEVVVGVKKKDFEVLSQASASDGTHDYAIEYEVATSTCKYNLVRGE